MTGGIKIPIDADLSGLNQAMDAFAQKAKAAVGQLNGVASIDTAKAKQSLDELQKAAASLHQQLSKTAVSDVTGKSIEHLSAGFEQAAKHAKVLEQIVGGVGNKGVSGMQKTVAKTRKLISELEKAKRLQAALAKAGQRVSLGQASELEKDYQFNVNQGGKKRFGKFGDMATMMTNWRDISSNEVASRRQYKEMMHSLDMGGAAAPGGGSPGMPPQQRTFQQFMADSLRRAGRGVGQSITGGAGVGSTIMGHAAEEAAGHGGLLSCAGMGRLAAGAGVGALAYGAVRGVAAIKGKMNSAEDEQIGYSDLLRKMGDTTASFEDLRGSIRSAATGIDMSFGEGATMAHNYVATAGVDGMSKDQMRNEIMGAGGFARSLGLDPEAGGNLMGSLRHAKVSSGDSDNKRFAMMIGEAVARAGVFSKADEVLSAVASYATSATRNGLAPANVEGYTGAIGNLMALKQAGLDPSMSAAMLGKADGAIRGGGSEASRNFALGVLQKDMPGITSVDAGLLHDQGAFGNAEKAFGKGSMAQRHAANDPALLAKYQRLAAQGGTTTTLDRELKSMSGMGTDDMRMNLKGRYGYSDSEAAAMITAHQTNGDMSSAVNNLGKYGVDTKSLAPTAIKHLLEMEYSDDPGILQKKSSFLRGQNLTAAESKSLTDAEASPGDGNGNLRTTLARLLSTRKMEATDGDVSRANKANLDNIASDLATKLIPMTNAIREAVTSMAKGAIYEDKFGNSEKAGVALDGALSGATSQEGRANAFRSAASAIAQNPDGYTPEYKKKVDAGLAAESAKLQPVTTPEGGEVKGYMSGDKGEFLKKTRPAAERAAAKINAKGGNVKPEWLQAQWGLETGWGAKMLPGTNNLGNVKGGGPGSKKFSALEQAPDGSVYRENSAFRAYGSLNDSADDYARLLMDNKRYSGALKAGTADGFADAMGASGYATDKSYGKKLKSTIGGMPLPANAKASHAPGATTVHVKGDFTVNDKNGRQIAPPLQVAAVAAPAASGAQR